METEIFNSINKGTKNFTPHDVHRVNETPLSTPADEYMEGGIDLNEQLIKNKPATFFFRMNGDSMNGAGIFSGDVLIVDRSITNVNGKVVIAVLNGEMLVRRLEKTLNKIRLIPETTRLAVIDVDPFADFAVWGVVTYVVHAP